MRRYKVNNFKLLLDLLLLLLSYNILLRADRCAHCELIDAFLLRQVLHFPLMQIHGVIEGTCSLLEVLASSSELCLLVLPIICAVNGILPALCATEAMDDHHVGQEVDTHANEHAAPEASLSLQTV